MKIELVVFALEALRESTQNERLITLSQLSQDCIDTAVFTHACRGDLLQALFQMELRQSFDYLVYKEMLRKMSSAELRKLASDATLWVRTADEVPYHKLHLRLHPRKRHIPAWALTSEIS